MYENELSSPRMGASSPGKSEKDYNLNFKTDFSLKTDSIKIERRIHKPKHSITQDGWTVWYNLKHRE